MNEEPEAIYRKLIKDIDNFYAQTDRARSDEDLIRIKDVKDIINKCFGKKVIEKCYKNQI